MAKKSWEDKPLKDFTKEEKADFINEVKRKIPPEDMQAFLDFVDLIEPENENFNQFMLSFFDSLKDFFTILQDEVEKDGEAANMPAEDFLTSEKLDLLMERAINRLDNKNDLLNDKLKDILPKITANSLKKIDFPLDKVNSNIWGLIEGKGNGGQLQYKFDVSRHESKTPLNVLYSIDFDSLEDVTITKKLDYYDKRVYIAVSNLYTAGYNIMTLQQIYEAMGYPGHAGKSDLNKINKSISKMTSAQIILDNTQEAQVYDRLTFKYDGSLLPMERLQAYVNGQLVQGAIRPLREPPVMSFARDRKQITTVSIRLLQSPLNKTDSNLRLEDYLIERIAHIKKGDSTNKILFETLYTATGITGKQRQRAPEKIKRLLNHYKEQDFIKDFKIVTDGITITY